MKQLEEISNQFKGVEKSFAIQAGREIRVMVVPEQVSDDDMVLMARNIAKQIEFELEYPGPVSYTHLGKLQKGFGTLRLTSLIQVR